MTDSDTGELFCALNLAEIIVALDNDIVSRKFISDIWGAKHPDHEIPQENPDRGTLKRRYMTRGIKCLERRGVLAREGENDLRILDMPAVKKMILRRELPPVQSVSE